MTAQPVARRLYAGVGGDNRCGLFLRQLHADHAGLRIGEDEVLPVDPERRLTVPRLDVDPCRFGQPVDDLLQPVHVPHARGHLSRGSEAPDSAERVAHPDVSSSGRPVAVDGGPQPADHRRKRWIVTKRPPPVDEDRRAIAVQDRQPGHLRGPAGGDAALTMAMKERSQVVPPAARVEDAQGRSAHAQSMSDTLFAVDEERERHAGGDERLCLEAVPDGNGEGAASHRLDLGIGLPHLRQVVAAGQSAVVAGEQEQDNPAQELAQPDRVAGGGLHLEICDRRRHCTIVSRTRAVVRRSTSSERTHGYATPRGDLAPTSPKPTTGLAVDHRVEEFRHDLVVCLGRLVVHVVRSPGNLSQTRSRNQVAQMVGGRS